MPKYSDGLVICDNCGKNISNVYFSHGDYYLCGSCHGPIKPKTKVVLVIGGGVKV